MWLKGTRDEDAKTFKQDNPERLQCLQEILVMGTRDRPGGSHQGRPAICPSAGLAGRLSAMPPWRHSSGRVPVSQDVSRRVHAHSAAAAAISQPHACSGCFSGLVRSSPHDPGSPLDVPEPSSPNPAAPPSLFSITLLQVWPVQTELIIYATVTRAVGRNALSSEPVGHQADYWSFTVVT